MRPAHWLAGCNYPYACVLRQLPGALLENCIRNDRIFFPTAERTCHCPPETWLVADSCRSVPDLIRPDDYADHRAGTDHRIAARADSRIVPRQHRTLSDQDEGSARRPCSRDPGSESGAIFAAPVVPGRPGTNSEPNSVNPGTKETCPVFPGRRTKPCSEPEAQNPDADAGPSGCGCG
jgi:hypothetical protein